MRPRQLQLIQRERHAALGPVQELLHPGGKGGIAMRGGRR